MPLDIYDDSSDPVNAPDERRDATGRPYVCLLFDCCKVYVRVYRRPEQQAYEARCPKCLRTVRLRVGPHGTTARFFLAE